MTRRLSYSPDNFVLHAGVREIFDAVNNLCQRPADVPYTPLILVYGSPRSGKTHLSIALSAALVSKCLYPQVVDGSDAADFQSICGQIEEGGKRVVLIDDCDSLLESLEPGKSGSFVGFWEKLRASDSTAILFLQLKGEAAPSLKCDEHVLSRLSAAASLTLGPPAAEDIPALITALALQRGVKLSPRKVQFIARRAAVSIERLEHYLDRVLYLSETLGRPVRFPALGDAL